MIAYARAKFIVETNARGQARYDANDLPLGKAQEYVSDPRVLADAMEMLKYWALKSDTKIVFTQLDEQDYQALTDYQKDDLVLYWTKLYPNLVMEYLKERLDPQKGVY